MCTAFLKFDKMPKMHVYTTVNKKLKLWHRLLSGIKVIGAL